MVQATSETLKVAKPRSPPSSSSGGSEVFMGRNVKYRGSRNRNLTMALGSALVDLTSAPHQLSEEENIIQQLLVLIHPHLKTVNSSSSGVEEVPSLPAPASPQLSSPASSTKTTPIKILNVNMITKSFAKSFFNEMV